MTIPIIVWRKNILRQQSLEKDIEHTEVKIVCSSTGSLNQAKIND